ncbi:MAG: hypothetical protein AAGF90_19150 [Pseudomonadota bacterium]
MSGFVKALAIAALTALAACSWLGEGDENDEPPAPAAEAPAGPPKVPVQRIRTLELGRLPNGFMLTAFGVAPGLGYYSPELRPRFGGRPGPDGFLEYDFLVREPDEPGQGENAPVAARAVRGDTPLVSDALRTAVGVRVWSERDSVEGLF